MKALPLLLAVMLLLPLVALAEPMKTDCGKNDQKAVVVPHKKIVKKKEEKPTPPVVFVAPPQKEAEIREVIKEVPVIVTVPVPVAAPTPVATPAPVAPIRKRPQHVDNSHPLDTDGIQSAPYNPSGGMLSNTMTGAAIGGSLIYGLSR